ncbi:type II toxin-antitoxin system RelE family toxin [Candidatus Trichorickettsia mobilis]|uniref:type II toxin-antitoxin system RelE family toxin n=1 Tax=Candidatus Trichorickettsia mobilis TaxID=1346319 RepID=UPI00292D28A8|nr:type II toxin-antitoxin system RelE/ParE family toxin [Candidatus Trichorickettsia mobilis]
MEIKYTIIYQEDVVHIHIPNLPTAIRRTIKTAIEERLTTNPIELGKPLRYSWKGHRRLRVGDYRIIYRIDFTYNTVIIVAIEHRKDVY